MLISMAPPRRPYCELSSVLCPYHELLAQANWIVLTFVLVFLSLIERDKAKAIQFMLALRTYGTDREVLFLQCPDFCVFIIFNVCDGLDLQTTTATVSQDSR